MAHIWNCQCRRRLVDFSKDVGEFCLSNNNYPLVFIFTLTSQQSRPSTNTHKGSRSPQQLWRVINPSKTHEKIQRTPDAQQFLELSMKSWLQVKVIKSSEYIPSVTVRDIPFGRFLKLEYCWIMFFSDFPWNQLCIVGEPPWLWNPPHY